MKHRKYFLYLAGALFFMMCGSLWNEYFVSKNQESKDSLSRHSVDPKLRSSVDPKFRKSNPSYYAVPKAEVESFEFDPNEADSTQLLRLGLTPAQVRSIYRHRAKGYVYSRVEDFAKTPFMTQGQWNHLKPLIRIGNQYKPVDLKENLSFRKANGAEGTEGSFAAQWARDESRSEPSHRTNDTLKHQRTHTTPKEHTSTVNGQCSMVSFRRANGAEGTEGNFQHRTNDTLKHQRSQGTPDRRENNVVSLNLNESSFKDLVHHPFLSYDQVKAIKNFQKKYGRIRNMTELLILPEFTVEDTVRLSPYLQF